LIAFNIALFIQMHQLSPIALPVIENCQPSKFLNFILQDRNLQRFSHHIKSRECQIARAATPQLFRPAEEAMQMSGAGPTLTLVTPKLRRE
jgi:hypothetical protein